MDPFENETKSEVSTSKSAQEKLKTFAKISAISHLILIPIVILLGNALIGIADQIGGWFDMKQIQLGQNDFWMVPIIGTLFTLAFSSFRVWQNPNKIDWLQPLLFIHGITAASFLIYFFVDARSMAYILAAVVGAAFFFATLYFWWSAKPQE